MRYLFTPRSLKTLEGYCLSRTLFAFDYDGTLAPIVDAPPKALMRARTAELLRKLAEIAPIAIISGRSLHDLKKLLPFKVKHLIGNHGLEGLPSASFSEKRASEAVGRWKPALKRELAQVAGLVLEDKGYSLAAHYRNARQKRLAKELILHTVVGLKPAPRVILGKYVVNLIPAGAPHKGIALMELILALGMNAAVFVGDDDTDEDVFGLPESRIMTIRVGNKHSSHARYFIKGQPEINTLLSRLVTISRKSKHVRNA